MPARPPATTKAAAPKAAFHPKLVALLLFLLALPLYANTIPNGYAVDDTIFITDNVYTKQGIRGIPDIFSHDSFQGYFQEKKELVSGGRYRPLSIATFALEYQVAGLRPALGHTVNLVVYGVVCALVYLLLLRLLPPVPRTPWWIASPFLITLLFMTHPLHTEVVANIKSRDEILGLLFGVAAFHAFLTWFERPAGRGVLYLAAGALLYFLGLLSKETLIPFLGIIPLGIWFFRKVDARRLGVVLATMALPLAGYFAIRATFAGAMKIVRTADLLNDPFSYATLEQRMATVFKTVGIYLRLFFVPHPLSSDYYYNQVPLTRLGDPASFLPALLTVGLAVFALLGTRRKNAIAFGLLFFAISFAIVSNLFFSIGTTMAERFLFTPSLGLAIATVLVVRAAFEKLLGKAGPRAAAIFLILVSAAFSVKTVLRNADWKDNTTLFLTDIKVSPNSAKIQAAVASVLEDEAKEKRDPARRQRLMDEAIGHFKKALEIYPEHSLAWFGLGNLLSGLGKERAAEAIQCYRHVLALEPEKAVAYRNLALNAEQLGDYETALEGIRRYRSFKPADVEAGLRESNYLAQSGQIEQAASVREELVRANPRNAQLWSDTAMFFANRAHNYPKAVEYLHQAMQLDSTKVAYYENLGYAQILNGQARAAVRTLETGVARFGETRLLQWNLGVAWSELGDRQKSERAIARSKALGGSR